MKKSKTSSKKSKSSKLRGGVKIEGAGADEVEGDELIMLGWPIFGLFGLSGEWPFRLGRGGPFLGIDDWFLGGCGGCGCRTFS